MQKYEGFQNLEHQFQYKFIDKLQPKVYKMLPRPNQILSKKIPLSNLPKIIQPFSLYKIPLKLQQTQTISKPFYSYLNKSTQKYLYKRYPIYQTFQQRYDNKQIQLVYDKYKQKNVNTYKNQCYTGRFINIYQLLHIQPDDCQLLVERDYTNRDVFNQLYYEKILFQSRFESGNLLKAFRIKDYEFDLLIQNDTNTKGYNQWFYFFMTNIPKNTIVRLNIVNMANNQSLFNQGMKPCVLSLKRYKNINKTWYRGGFDILYEKNTLKKCKQQNSFYSVLSFSFQFEYFEDIVFFSTTFPYTYTKLLKQIHVWQSKLKIQKDILAITPGQNYCYILTLGNPHKPVILIIARQHPGQTVSNYLLEGIIQQLISDPNILNSYLFKIIPMVNVDGCIYGNFRSNLIGVDMNRKWSDPERYFTPQIVALKNLIIELKKNKNLKYFIDLHGHSRNYSTFIYSSNKTKFSKTLPCAINEINQGFDKKKCTFGIDKSKQATARANVYNLIRRCQSMTIQTSFYGYKIGNQFIDHYPQIILKLGSDIIKSFSQAQRNYIDFKFQNINDKGSDEDPTEDYLQQIQKKVDEICNQYRNNSPLKSRRYKTLNKQKPLSQIKIRKRQNSAYSKLTEKIITTQLNSKSCIKNQHSFSQTVVRTNKNINCKITSQTNQLLFSRLQKFIQVPYSNSEIILKKKVKSRSQIMKKINGIEVKKKLQNLINSTINKS